MPFKLGDVVLEEPPCADVTEALPDEDDVGGATLGKVKARRMQCRSLEF